MELRHRVVGLIFALHFTVEPIFSNHLLAQEKSPDQQSKGPSSDHSDKTSFHTDETTLVEATPIDVFSDRATLWPAVILDSTNSAQRGLSPFVTLNSTAGIQSRLEGSPTISIRGSQSLPRVLGLYNGIPINSASGFGANKHFIAQEVLEQTRVIKGPASVFYGNDAMGGAMNFLTSRFKTPTIRAGYGSQNYKSIFGVLPLWSNNKRNYHHITAYSEGADNNYPYKLNSTSTTGVRDFNNQGLERLTFFGAQEQGRFSFAENLIWAQESNASPGPVTSPMVTQSRIKSGLASVSSKVQINHSSELSHRVFATTSATEARDSTGISNSQSSKIANNLDFSKRWNSDWSSDFFFDHSYNDFKATYAGERHYTENDFELGMSLNYSTFGNIVLRPASRYLFTYNKFINAIGLFEESSSEKKWITYSEGYHSPSLLQRFASYGSAAANPDLKPELSSQVEIGFEKSYSLNQQSPWNTATLGLSIFSTNYKDYISTRRLPDNRDQPFNTDSARSYGLEVKTNLEIENWNLRAEYSHLQTETNHKLPLALSPENQYQIGAGLRFSILHLELIHTLWDRFYENQNNGVKELNGWNSTDFHVSSVGVKNWTIKGSVLNFLDHSIELTRGYPEPQRRFFLSAERRF